MDKPVSLAERIADLPDLMRDAGIAALEDQVDVLVAEAKALQSRADHTGESLRCIMAEKRVDALVEVLRSAPEMSKKFVLRRVRYKAWLAKRAAALAERKP